LDFFNDRVRAGVTYQLGGENELAWPILEEATSFDWQRAGIWEDRHFTEWAFFGMLSILAESDNRAGFSDLFWCAVARGQEIDYHFPSINPKQELLLDLCDRLGLERELAHVVDSIRRLRDKLPRRLAKRLNDVMICDLKPVIFDRSWRSAAVVGLARTMHDNNDFYLMPIFADALEDAGCSNPHLIKHCRENGEHRKGCWVVNLVLNE